MVHLTESTFKDFVGGENNALVEFYAPWYKDECVFIINANLIFE